MPKSEPVHSILHPSHYSAIKCLILDDLDNNRVYGLWCSARRAFGTDFYPATGEEHKRNWRAMKDAGAVPVYRGGTVPKDCYIVRLPDDSFVAMQLYRGNYQPLIGIIRFHIKRKHVKTNKTRKTR